MKKRSNNVNKSKSNASANANINHILNNYIAFWKPNADYGYMSQWYMSNFVFDEQTIADFPQQIKELELFKNRYDVITMLAEHNIYSCAEKFMMMGKAALFQDKTVFRLIAATDNPDSHKKLGRQVRNFSDDIWNIYCKDIVIIGNYLKFSQDQKLKQNLLDTKDAVLIEGSPFDKIWGVGIKFDDLTIRNKNLWKGTNYLGECIEIVRTILQSM